MDVDNNRFEKKTHMYTGRNKKLLLRYLWILFLPPRNLILILRQIFWLSILRRNVFSALYQWRGVPLSAYTEEVTVPDSHRFPSPRLTIRRSSVSDFVFCLTIINTPFLICQSFSHILERIPSLIKRGSPKRTPDLLILWFHKKHKSCRIPEN